MANSSQIEIFKFTLPKKFDTFREFIQAKFYDAQSPKQNDAHLFNKLFTKFLEPLCKNNVWTLEDKKKGLTIYKQRGEDVNTIIKAYSDSCVIEGYIDGGRYDMIRKLSDLSDNTKPRNIKASDIVAARYYMYLFIPLDKKIAVLFLERKSDDQIRDVVKGYLSVLFGDKKACRVDAYYPQSLIDNFKDTSVVESLTSIDYYTSPVGEDDGVRAKTYEVTVQIKPVGESIPYEDVDSIVNATQDLSVSFLGECKRFVGFIKRKGVMKNKDTNKTSTFDFDKGEMIRPCIPLDEDYISQGVLDREKIKAYCASLLNSIKNEIYGTT